MSDSASQPKSVQNNVSLTKLEKLLSQVDGEGRYQFISFIIFSILWFLASWTMVGQSFFFSSDFTCFKKSNPKNCQQFVCSLPADERKLAIQSHSNSIVFAFQEYMICDQDYLPSFFISLFYFGSLFGFLLIPMIADNYGRKIAIKISWGIYGIGIFLLGFSISPIMVGLGQFLAGFGCNPAITLTYSFINEQCLGKSQEKYGTGVQICFAVGECVIGLLFLPKMSWRLILLILLGLCFLAYLSLSYILESPKFMIYKNKRKTLQILNGIGSRNKRPQIRLEQLNEIEECKNQSCTILDLFKDKKLRTKTISSGFTFFGIQVIYYSALLNLDSIGFNKVTNQQIVGISEGLSFLITHFYITKMPRKKFSILGMTFSSLTCFILANLSYLSPYIHPYLDGFISIFVLIANRLVLCSFWALFYVYLGEMYPTKVRSLGIGWASAMGTFGSILSPYLTLLSHKNDLSIWIIPGIIGFLCVFSLFFLPETFEASSDDQIQDKKQKQKYE